MIGEHTEYADDKVRIMAKMMADGQIKDVYDIHNNKKQGNDFKILQDADDWLHKKLSVA